MTTISVALFALAASTFAGLVCRITRRPRLSITITGKASTGTIFLSSPRAVRAARKPR